MKSRRWSPSAMPCAVRLEQPHRLAGFGFVEHACASDARHLALVILVRAEHVEEFQARPLRRQLLLLHARDRPAPDRTDACSSRRDSSAAAACSACGDQSSSKPCCAVAIGRGRRRIDERRPGRRAPVEQAQRQAEIGLDHEVAVGRGGVGDRAEMDHGVELAAVEPARTGRRAGRSRRAGAWPRLRHLPSVPSTSLTTISVRPASLRPATTFDPINPAPPVTNNIDADPARRLPRGLGPSFAPVRTAAQLAGSPTVNAGGDSAELDRCRCRATPHEQAGQLCRTADIQSRVHDQLKQ